MTYNTNRTKMREKVFQDILINNHLAFGAWGVGRGFSEFGPCVPNTPLTSYQPSFHSALSLEITDEITRLALPSYRPRASHYKLSDKFSVK